MIDINNYISRLTELLKKHFDKRFIYLGLQGSYLRGDESDNSDIDIMVVIDGLTTLDLNTYKDIIKSIGHYDKSCGFICSKEDMLSWNPLEICHLVNSTKDYYGVLRELVPTYTKNDIRNFVKLSTNNLYHEICHRYIHSTPQKNIEQLPFSYKSVFFILQNIYYINNGIYISTKAELLNLLDGKNRAVLECYINIKSGLEYNFEECFELLFSWCQETLQSI